MSTKHSRYAIPKHSELYHAIRDEMHRTGIRQVSLVIRAMLNEYIKMRDIRKVLASLMVTGIAPEAILPEPQYNNADEALAAWEE